MDTPASGRHRHERATTTPGRDLREGAIAALLALLVYVALAILMGIADIFFVLYIGYAIATIIPSIAVAIRRLHDTNKSGWFLLLGLIPFVGAILLIVFYATEGTNGPNDHGAAAEPAA